MDRRISRSSSIQSQDAFVALKTKVEYGVVSTND